MKAMILAAGLGTRLRPLTDVCPKPLIPIANIPVIERTITYLKRYGYQRMAVNTHHHADSVAAFLGDRNQMGVKFHVSHEPAILGTGGGIRNIEEFWGNDTLLVINGDILTDIDLEAALGFHRAANAPATLVLHRHPSFGKIVLDEKNGVLDISREPVPERLAFTGIHFLEPLLLKWLPAEGFADIVDCYRHMIEAGERIAGHVSSGHYWRDIGTIPDYLEANREHSHEPLLLGHGSEVAPSARISQWAVIGPGCRVEGDAAITRSVLWQNVTVRKGVQVMDSVVTSGKTVHRNLEGETLV